MSETWITNLEELSTFASTFLATNPRGAAVGLRGELGAGKTAFVRACIEALSARRGMIKPRVGSPTFVIHQSYPHLVPRVEHFDLYRMEKASPEMLVDIGYFEALEQVRSAGGFLFVEWPECVADPTILHLSHEISIELFDTRRKFAMQCI